MTTSVPTTASVAARRRAWGSAIFCAAVASLLLATRASAQPAIGATPMTKVSGLVIDAQAILGERTVSQTGWNEILLRLKNDGASPFKGLVRVHTSDGSSRYGGNDPAPTTAKISLAPGARVRLHLPAQAVGYNILKLSVFDAAGNLVHQNVLREKSDASIILFDAGAAQPLKASLDQQSLVFTGPASGARHHSTASNITLDVALAPRDAATGDVVLPRFSVGYSSASVVRMPSDQLTSLDAAELHALANWVNAGGNLAINISRPEDLRHATLAAFVGATPTPQPVPAMTTLDPSLVETLELKGYSGGNLRESPVGATASYGLGQVHILAFDPSSPAAVESLFVVARMLQLVERSERRRPASLFPIGTAFRPNDTLARELDPNVGSRWPIAFGGLLLLLYSVVAGPLNFARHRKRGRPLHSLRALPILSLGTFLLIALVGTFAKGCSDRSRRLVLAEFGAGSTHGHATRWRSFFGPRATTLGVGTNHQGSVVGAAIDDNGSALAELRVVRDALRLENLQVRPWQTAIVRDNSPIDLPGSISLLNDGSGGVTVVNRTGRNLRGLVLWLPSGTLKFGAKLADGETVNSHALSAIPQCLEPSTPPALFTIESGHCGETMAKVSPGLEHAWIAISQQSSPHRIWFPDDVPVLLAQVDGGDGETRDAGIKLEHNRLLIRVVGYGGRR